MGYQNIASMIQAGQVSVAQTTTTILRVQEELKVQSSSLFPMLVSPTEMTMNSTLHLNSSNATPCVFNNTTGANANIAFRYRSNFWNAGMDGGNFRIQSNWLLSHSIPAGANLASTVAVQINQDAKTSFANDVNVWGNLNTYQKS